MSGTHAVGKSTLIGGLLAALPDFEVVEEPYRDLLERGYTFEDPPVAEDFEVQLECSLASLADDRDNLIFDRAPADFLAYVAVVRSRQGVDAISACWSDVSAAMRRFDLIVYVPVERPDRIRVPRSDYPRLRRRVDDELRRLLVDDELGIADSVIEVRGSMLERQEQVLTRLSGSGWRNAAPPPLRLGPTR